MTYHLYNRLGSGGFVVEAALSLLAVPFELRLLDSVPGEPLPESFKEMNAWHQVPVLTLGDGTSMTESGAMLIHLSNAHPPYGGTPAPGTPAHAQFIRWIVFLSANVYEAILRRGYPHRYTEDSEGTKSVSLSAAKRCTKALSQIEAVLENSKDTGPFLFGAKMSLADPYIAMFNAWNGEGRGLERCDHLTHKVAADPIIAPIWQRNFDHRLQTQWGR